MQRFPRVTAAALVVAGAMIAVPQVSASTIQVGIAAFGAGSALTTFTGLASLTEVNGITVDGILFQYSLGNGNVAIGTGPGSTNNLAAPSITSTLNPNGVLTLTLPSLVDTFGYGYAVFNTISVANASTITLFNGATNVGSQSYNGVPDPLFSGGFAGIQSTLPFDRVQLTFNVAQSPGFAVDNIRTFSTAATAVPEPASVMLVGTGVLALVRTRRRRPRMGAHRPS